jgi:hypothetical protein
MEGYLRNHVVEEITIRKTIEEEALDISRGNSPTATLAEHALLSQMVTGA